MCDVMLFACNERGCRCSASSPAQGYAVPLDLPQNPVQVGIAVRRVLEELAARGDAGDEIRERNRGPAGERCSDDVDPSPEHGSAAWWTGLRVCGVPDLSRRYESPQEGREPRTALTLARRTGLKAAATGLLFVGRGRVNGAGAEPTTAPGALEGAVPVRKTGGSRDHAAIPKKSLAVTWPSVANAIRDMRSLSGILSPVR